MRWQAWLALTLAITAGGVDAIGLAGVGRYASHTTGATTHAIVGGVSGDIQLLLLGMQAILCFVAGAFVAGIIVSRPGAPNASATLTVLIGTEAILVLAGGVFMALLPTRPWDGMTVIGCFAAAMGTQNAASTYLLSPYKRTTHLTSNMTDLGCELGLRLRGWAGLPTGGALISPYRETIIGAALPIVGFAAGASGGAVLHLAGGRWSGIAAASPPAIATLWLIAARPKMAP